MSQTEKINVITASMECCMCPTIFSGRTAGGVTVYARYRWGHLSVRIDRRDPPPHGGAAGLWIIEKAIDPDGLAGCLTYDELKSHTADYVEWPDALSTKINDDTDSWLEL